MPNEDRPRVVIVGGGFAGIAAAHQLRNAAADIVVIDKTNHHLFQPLLYQVATATLAPSDIAAPIRWLLRKQRNTRVVLGAVSGIDRSKRLVHIEGAPSEAYDYLILATGTRHAYFGHAEWEPLAPGLKSLDDALDIRHRFLSAFEMAEQAMDEPSRNAWLTFVVVGGGPTGVELAGIMMTIARTALRPDFRRIDTARTRLVLAEAGPRLLPALRPQLAARAHEDLVAMGVEVRTNTRVTRIEGDAVWLGDERLPAETVFWAAGNQAHVFSKIGDSITVAPTFLVPFGWGSFNLRDEGYLADVVNFYAGGWARNGNSFNNTSLAAKGGWSSFTVLSPSQADHSVCHAGEPPLWCEYRLSRPSVALIMVGTNDVMDSSSDAYRANLQRIVADSLSRGIVPVLSTIPAFHRAGYEARVAELNGIIADVAHQNDIPLWDYWSALESLPNEGLGPDGIHPSAAPNSADFTADNLQFGYTVRNLTALQALDALWHLELY